MKAYFCPLSDALASFLPPLTLDITAEVSQRSEQRMEGKTYKNSVDTTISTTSMHAFFSADQGHLISKLAISALVKRYQAMLTPNQL